MSRSGSNPTCRRRRRFLQRPGAALTTDVSCARSSSKISSTGENHESRRSHSSRREPGVPDLPIGAEPLPCTGGMSGPRIDGRCAATHERSQKRNYPDFESGQEGRACHRRLRTPELHRQAPTDPATFTPSYETSRPTGRSERAGTRRRPTSATSRRSRLTMWTRH